MTEPDAASSSEVSPGSGRAPDRRDSPAALVRAARLRQRITPERLARRAGVDAATVEQVEAGAVVPDQALLTALLLVCGEQSCTGEDGLLSSRPLPRHHDREQLARERAKPPHQRLQEAFAWNRFAHETWLAGRRARGKR